MVRARRVTPHESERRARTMLSLDLSACSDTPEGSVAKSGYLVTCLRDLERGVEA